MSKPYYKNRKLVIAASVPVPTVVLKHDGGGARKGFGTLSTIVPTQEEERELLKNHGDILGDDEDLLPKSVSLDDVSKEALEKERLRSKALFSNLLQNPAPLVNPYTGKESKPVNDNKRSVVPDAKLPISKKMKAEVETKSVVSTNNVSKDAIAPKPVTLSTKQVAAPAPAPFRSLFSMVNLINSGNNNTGADIAIQPVEASISLPAHPTLTDGDDRSEQNESQKLPESNAKSVAIIGMDASKLVSPPVSTNVSANIVPVKATIAKSTVPLAATASNTGSTANTVDKLHRADIKELKNIFHREGGVEWNFTSNTEQSNSADSDTQPVNATNTVANKANLVSKHNHIEHFQSDDIIFREAEKFGYDIRDTHTASEEFSFTFFDGEKEGESKTGKDKGKAPAATAIAAGGATLDQGKGKSLNQAVSKGEVDAAGTNTNAKNKRTLNTMNVSNYPAAPGSYKIVPLPNMLQIFKAAKKFCRKQSEEELIDHWKDSKEKMVSDYKKKRKDGIRNKRKQFMNRKG